MTASVFDVIILGAGVVGLACAEALAQQGQSVVVLERHAQIARETSSRNSGVVHAGIYYPPQSQKTKLCLRGRELLTERAARGRITLRPVGKIIVATSAEELQSLAALQQNAMASGVELVPLSAADVRRLEPAVQAVAGLHSVGSAILDPHELAHDCLRAARSAGATMAHQAQVVGIEQRSRSGWAVRVLAPDGTEYEVQALWVINAAGLDADHVVSLAGVDVDGLGLRQYPCKGSYFTVSGRLARSVSRLIYPLPDATGLGIHLTLDLGGSLRAGPDAEYVTDRGLSVDENKRALFATAIGRFLPGVSAADFSPAYAGLRPKLSRAGEGFRDFVIRHEEPLGLAGLVNLLGIESPGLTASLAIAELVSRIVSGEVAQA